MDAWETQRPQHRRKTPSFSSSLLDAIYRSIDESNGEEELPGLVFCRDSTISMRKKQSISPSLFLEDSTEEVPSLRRAIMIDKWMENRSNSSRSSRHLNSNSSSSDSSCGGIFSSSEAESSSKSTAKSSVSSMDRPKQSRTCMFVRSERSDKVTHCDQTPKHEGRFMRTTKSRALKIYGDLKKVKQPISPGGRIASFLNSLFNSRTVKSTKLDDAMEDLSSMRKSRSAKDSTTHSSSVPSFSRSCLSTKSSNSNGLKRSVRFCPVSIIVDEDCRPCGQKSIYEDDHSVMRNLKKNQFLERSNAKRDRFRDYQVKKSNNVSRYEFREFQLQDGDDDEVESCSSSDLFELENIGAYREELPVYGTTNLKTNYAIANGLIL